MTDYAQGRKAQNTDLNRESYDKYTNNCATFTSDTLNAGGVETPREYMPADYSAKAREKADKVYDYPPPKEEPKK